METTTLNLLVIRSRDLALAESFYLAIGLNFTRHAHGKGPEHLAAECDSLVFEIYPQTLNKPATTATRIGFRVSNIDRVLKELELLGAHIKKQPTESEWGRRAIATDFDGHTIELLQQ